MEQRQIDRMLLHVSIGSFLLMSISFLLMPIESINILPGLMFWLGLGLGVALQIVLESRRRAFVKSYSVKRGKTQKSKNGMLSFGSNTAAVIADGFMAISFVAMVLTFVLTKGYKYVCYVFIATTVFSFSMHCILNGRIYVYVGNQIKVQRILERKKVKSREKRRGKYEQR